MYRSSTYYSLLHHGCTRALALASRSALLSSSLQSQASKSQPMRQPRMRVRVHWDPSLSTFRWANNWWGVVVGSVMQNVMRSQRRVSIMAASSGGQHDPVHGFSTKLAASMAHVGHGLPQPKLSPSQSTMWTGMSSQVTISCGCAFSRYVLGRCDQNRGTC